MNIELKTLKDEISIYKESTDPESKKTLKQKTEKLVLLTELKEAINNYQEQVSVKSIKNKLDEDVKPSSELQKSTDKLYTIYNKYVKYLAKETTEHPLDDDIANSFKGIKDYYALRHDNQLAALAINTLADPNFLNNYVDRSTILQDIAQERIIENRRSALASYIKKKEDNDLLNALYEAGVYVNPEDTEALIARGIVPNKIYDTVTHEELVLGSEKYEKVQVILSEYKLISTPVADAIITTPGATISTDIPLNKITILTPWEEVPQEIKLALVPEFKKWNALKDEDEQFPVGKKTDEQLSSISALKSFWLHNTETREIILKAYNEKTGRTQTGPIVTLGGAPVIVSGGAIIYASPGVGKSTLAEGSAIYMDGDKILYDVMKSKGLNPTSVQEAGIELAKEPGSIINLVEKETLARFKDFKNQGRIVLTSNRFSYDIVDKAYLSKDMKRMADEFQRRNPALSREDAERQAASKIKNETEALQGKEIIDIPQGDRKSTRLNSSYRY